MIYLRSFDFYEKFIFFLSLILSFNAFSQISLPKSGKTIDLTSYKWYFRQQINSKTLILNPEKDKFGKGCFIKIPKSYNLGYVLEFSFKITEDKILTNQRLMVENFYDNLDVYINKELTGKTTHVTQIFAPTEFNLPLLHPDSTYTISLVFSNKKNNIWPITEHLLNRGINVQIKNTSKIDWLSFNYRFSDTRWFQIFFLEFLITCIFYSVIIYQAKIFPLLVWILFITFGLLFPFISNEYTSELTQKNLYKVLFSMSAFFFLSLTISNFSILGIINIKTKFNKNFALIQFLFTVFLLVIYYFNLSNKEIFIYLFFILDIAMYLIAIFLPKVAIKKDGINRAGYILLGNFFFWVESFIDLYFLCNYALQLLIPVIYFIIYFTIKSILIIYHLNLIIKIDNKNRYLILFLFSIMFLSVLVGIKYLSSSELWMFLGVSYIPICVIFIVSHSISTNRRILSNHLKLLNLEKERSKVLEIEVENRTQELKQAMETRDQLLQVLAHDFRSQIVNIHNFLQLIAHKGKEVFSDKLIEFTNNNIRKVRDLQLNIDNTLLWGMSQKNSLTTKVNSVNVLLFINNIISQYNDEIDINNLKIDIICKQHIEKKFDEFHISIALRNLISNSIKYSSSKTPITIEVCDQYLSIKNSLSDNFELSRGTGLGLNISKSLIEKNNFKIETLKGEYYQVFIYW